MGANEWVGDLTDPDETEDEPDDEPDAEPETESEGSAGASESLFADRFGELIENEEIEQGMTVSAIGDKIDKIDDPDVLEEALEVDGRTTAQDVYAARLEDLGEGDRLKTEQAEGSDDGEESETEPETTDDTDETAESESVADDGDGESNEVVDATDDEVSESVPADSDDGQETTEGADDPDIPADGESAQPATQDVVDATDDTADTEPETESDPDLDLDVSAIAPDAVDRETAVAEDKPNSLYVWGPEGSGKSHIAHSAPGPICYIDTEHKANELADKFDKRIWYFEPDDYQEASDAMEQSIKLLTEVLDQTGQRGTIVVDSMTKMWEWAQIDYAQLVFQTDKLSEVQDKFKSQMQGEKDWTEIKARHNEEFRDRILETPFNVVMTAGEKEDYNAVMQGADGKPMTDNGEKFNRYAVRDVVQLRHGDDGKTVGDLRKAARVRRSFVGLEWPEWESIYGAVDRIYEAEQSDEQVDVSGWPFGVVDGQPVAEGPDGDDDE